MTVSHGALPPRPDCRDPGPACHEVAIVRALSRAGTDAFRINCNHGTHGEHATAIANVRLAEGETGQPRRGAATSFRRRERPGSRTGCGFRGRWSSSMSFPNMRRVFARNDGDVPFRRAARGRNGSWDAIVHAAAAAGSPRDAECTRYAGTACSTRGWCLVLAQRRQEGLDPLRRTVRSLRAACFGENLLE